MKNKPVQNCRVVHHVKFPCIMTTLNIFFKFEFERGELEKSRSSLYNIGSFPVSHPLKKLQNKAVQKLSARQFSCKMFLKLANLFALTRFDAVYNMKSYFKKTFMH